MVVQPWRCANIAQQGGLEALERTLSVLENLRVCAGYLFFL